MSSNLRRRLRRVARNSPQAYQAAKYTLDSARAERDLRAVRDSGLFDREWYEAQAGSRFSSDTQAMRHYLREGRRRGWSPHPLFEPTSADPNRWRKATIDPLVSELGGQRPNNGRPRPGVTFAKTGSKGLRAWARKAGPDTPVPFDSGPPVTWRELRTRALQIAEEQGRQRRLAGAAASLRKAPRFPPPVVTATGTGAPLVSIIMPTWNRAATLRRAVESVQRQLLTDWELIIVDDGSDDDTPGVVEGITSRDHRVRGIRADHVGVCHARNVGLAQAQGRYVAFLDSDNEWTPQFLAGAYAFAESGDVPWGHAALEIEYTEDDDDEDDGNAKGTGNAKGSGSRNAKNVKTAQDAGARPTYRRYLAFEGSRAHLLVGNYIDLNVVFVRRDTLERVGGFDESLRRAVDYDLILRLSEVAPPRLIPVLGAMYREQTDDENRISVAEPFSWNILVKLRHAARELAGVTQGPPATVPSRLSVVVPVRNRPAWAVDLVHQLADANADVEVIVVLAGAPDWVGRTVSIGVMNRPNVHVLTVPGEMNFAASVNLGAMQATGEYLVGWRANCTPVADWHTGLVAALAHPDTAIVQPLNLRPDGRIASAGGVFVDGDITPSRFLDAMPAEDAEALVVTPLPVVHSDVFALRTSDFRAIGELNALYGNSYAEIDLALRLRAAGRGGSTLVRGSTVVAAEAARYGLRPDPSASARVLRAHHTAPAGSAALWELVDFEVLGRRVVKLPALESTPIELGAVPVVRPRVHERPRRLRWAIDIAAPSGPAGDTWGDLHFARSLARALEALGQRVHVDRREVRERSHRDHDDVTLVLRGLDDVLPRPGSRSIMWVISHPDEVTEPTAARFDVVFAASQFWAESMSKRWSLPIGALLQCTDANLFSFSAGEPDSGDEFLFVGNSRRVKRLAVSAALDAGLPLAVYGKGWDGLVPDEVIHGNYVANDRLASVYAAAGVVLNDHWDDMRHDGFISNRVFDVLAAGGRIVSDDVPGLDHIFGGAVPVFHSHHDLKRLFAGDWRSRFPDLDARRELSERIRRDHSFDARARTLLDTAMRLHAEDEARR